MDVVSVSLENAENEKSFRKHEPEVINLKSRQQNRDEIIMV